jgi:transposase-like protein
MSQYNELVEKAKSLLSKRNELKYDIAKIAIEACSCRIGGRAGKNEYTVARFAFDIGLNANTLHRWKREYELVISKVPKGKISRKALEETLKKVGKNTPAKDVASTYKAEEEKFKTKDDHHLYDIIKRLKNIDFSINHSLQLSKLDRQLLEQVGQLSKNIYFGVDNFLSGRARPADKRQAALEKVVALVTQ